MFFFVKKKGYCKKLPIQYIFLLQHDVQVLKMLLLTLVNHDQANQHTIVLIFRKKKKKIFKKCKNNNDLKTHLIMIQITIFKTRRIFVAKRRKIVARRRRSAHRRRRQRLSSLVVVVVVW